MDQRLVRPQHLLPHYNLECADVEHAEPGTGSPPQPREKPIERDAEDGWRRDTPPIVEELE